MKTLISTFVVALAMAFTGPAFAGDVSKATTEAECKEAGGLLGCGCEKVLREGNVSSRIDPVLA